MRIVHVTESFLPIGGETETQIANLARRQAGAGHDVLVLTRTKGTPAADSHYPFDVFRYVWLGGRGSTLVDPRAPSRFEAAIAEFEPDIVHVHLAESAPVVQRVLKRLAVGHFPTVVTVHSRWSAFPKAPLYAQLAKSLGDAPIVWTGASEVVADRVAKVLGVKETLVLPPGLDQSAWLADPIPHDDILFVADSYFAPRERMLEFINMLVELARKVPKKSFRAVIAGNGPVLFQAERSVVLRELRRFIELPAELTRAELVELYASADVFVAPAIKDAAPLAPFEAQAAGLAVLARSQSGVGMQLTATQGAVASSDKEMVEIMQGWVENPALVRTIKERNRQALSPLDWSLTMPRVEEIYSLAENHFR